jgi:fluoride ion exporter CrcB/FEX
MAAEDSQHPAPSLNEQPSVVPSHHHQHLVNQQIKDARASFRRKSIEAAHEVSRKDWRIYDSSDLSLSSSLVSSSLRRRRLSSRQSLVTAGGTIRSSERRKDSWKEPSDRNLQTEEKGVSTTKEKDAPEILQSHALDSSFISTASPKKFVTRSPFLTSRHFHTLISLGLFSYLGEFTRWFTEELFGLACHQPDTVEWNVREWAPCTTASGTTESTGGAMFTDLPPNILGCFLMGLLVTGDTESIAVNLPMVILPRNASFQQWTVTHVGMRTGFCGSLTTLASWNTQMVVMICGGSATAIGSSQWVSALFGYFVGLFVALQSFLLGQSIAIAIGRRCNPHLAREADAVMDKKEMGILVNRDLPDFERRFLHDIIVEENDDRHLSPRLQQQKSGDTNGTSGSNLQRYGNDVYQSPFDNHIHHLQAWKESTDQHRHTSSPYVHLLQSIEKAVIVDRQEPRQELLEMARDAGWNVKALRNWVVVMDEEGEMAENNNNNNNNDIPLETITRETNVAMQAFWNDDHSIVEMVLNLSLFLFLTGLFIWGAIYFNDSDPVSVNYRNQFLSALLSPMGTFVRWYLSSFNGKIQNRRWEWLPVGTLLANMIACVLSALTQGLLHTLNPDSSQLAISFSDAIKVGFAGSMSTVSTFAAETIGLFRALPRFFWGWYYSFGTLALGLALGIMSYVWAIV